MTLPKNVKDAVKELQRKAFAFDAMVAANRISEDLEAKSLALADGPTETLAAATIRSHLMSQEAEITARTLCINQLSDDLKNAESRLAAANALLREIDRNGVLSQGVRARITDYMQGDGDA